MLKRKLVRATAALFLGALLITQVPAGSDILQFIPAEAQVVLLVDLEAAKAEPQLANSLTMIDQTVQSQNPDQELPSLAALSGLGFGLIFPNDPAAMGPDAFLAVRTSASFSSVPAIAQENGMMAQEMNGQTYYTDGDSAIVVSSGGDLLLMSQNIEDLSRMMSASQGGGSLAQQDIAPGSGTVQKPIVYLHVDKLDTLGPDMANAEMMATGFLTMAMADMTPEEQKVAQKIGAIMPQVFSASGYDVFVGFDAESMVTEVRGQMADANAAAAVKGAIDEAMKLAVQQDPMAQQYMDQTSVAAAGNVLHITTKMPKQQVLQMVPMAVSMALMQAMSGMGGGSAPPPGGY